MNRTVFLSVPEPDEDDLKETAIAIADEFEDGLGLHYQSIFDNLSKSYFLSSNLRHFVVSHIQPLNSS